MENIFKQFFLIITFVMIGFFMSSCDIDDIDNENKESTSFEGTWLEGFQWYWHFHDNEIAYYRNSITSGWYQNRKGTFTFDGSYIYCNWTQGCNHSSGNWEELIPPETNSYTYSFSGDDKLYINGWLTYRQK